MIKIRKGVFETNSSSTHTLTITSKSVYDSWKSGEIYFNSDVGELQTMEEMQKTYDEDGNRYYDTFEEYCEENIKTYDEWRDDDCLETFSHDYTSESGDKIVVFGKYGYDC